MPDAVRPENQTDQVSVWKAVEQAGLKQADFGSFSGGSQADLG